MDVFSISSIRRGISAIISNIGNKGKVPLSGNLGMDKVLDKSDKVTGVLLMGDRDGISSGAPKISGLSTPETMSPLFPSSK